VGLWRGDGYSANWFSSTLEAFTKLFEAVLQLPQVVLDGLTLSGRERWKASWQES
jgi:hypothetical protein